MIEYRPFRNPDVPGLVAVWNEACTGRGSVHFPCWTPFEEHVLAKTYFDRAGLVVAVDQDTLVGFGHAGFGPNESRSALNREHGQVCLVAVHPASRRRGVGSELLRRCVEYLRACGARTVVVGGADGNPFYFGLYGGSVSVGVLGSDETGDPFLKARGFEADGGFAVLQRRLSGPLGIVDGRFAESRRLYDFRCESRRGVRSWWEECLLGPLELHDFLLDEKATGRPAARATLWEMGGFGQRWNESAAGLIEVEVRPDLRRRGLARFLLAQTFRYLQDQFFTLVETQVPRDDVAATGLCQSVGFHAVDVSHTYRLSVPS